MITFPRSTVIHRRIPKEAFYKRLPLSSAVKESFVSDIDSIFVENSLTRENLNLTEAAKVKEILLLSVWLKKQNYDRRLIEAIARQNPHKLVFLLCYGEQRQLALYHSKLYRTQWMTEDKVKLEANGFSLEEIWNVLIQQIGLYEERAEFVDQLSIDERLALQEKILKLEKQIEKTEAAAWKERQPKKRFELYTKVQTYKQKLEELRHGQAENANA